MADDEGGQHGSFRHYLTLEDGTTVPIPKETFRRLVIAKNLGSKFIVGETHGEAWGQLCRSLWPELVEESELRKLAGEPLSDRKLMECWRSWTDRPIPGTHADWKHLAHWVGIEVPKDITDEWIEGDLLPALTARKQREADQVAAATRQKQTIEAAADDDGKGSESVSAKEKKSESLRPSDQKAFSQCEHAMKQQPTLNTDDEVYDWLLEDAEADDAPLPRRDSWKRMVGRARAFHDQRKNGPRIGNETRSVVSAKRLDTAKRTKTDQR